MNSLLMRNSASHDKRCSWVNVDDPLLVEYHDREWGVPIHNDRKHFEVLVLSGAQAGLNWSLVLKKREGYRRAFDNFDPEKVARYSENQIQTLLADPNIIRNRMKIEAKLNRWKTIGQIPATSPESEAFSKDLKHRGFRFAGPTVMYAYMQAAGMVNDHFVECFRYREIMREVANAN
jgi:DNA-3-methyladenine glycosylase I